jgi:hypothetical protein
MNERIKEVEKIKTNGIDEFYYNGIYIDRQTWEDAPCPICCENISDDNMCKIIITLYDELVTVYGLDEVKKYISYKNKQSINELDEFTETELHDMDNIDDYRWTIEEQLFNEFGGVYYEDMEDDEDELDDEEITPKDIVLKYVLDRLDKLNTDLLESKEYLSIQGTRTFLINEAQKCYQLELSIVFFKRIRNIIRDNINLDDLINFLNFQKKETEKELLNANFSINNTNEMVNITNIWDFQYKTKILKEIEILLKKIEK